MATKKTETKDALVGKFFHSFIEGTEPKKVQWQGCVVSKIDERYYLIETFSWIMGEPYCLNIVTIYEMKKWDFYKNAKDMREMYDNKYSRREK